GPPVGAHHVYRTTHCGCWVVQTQAHSRRRCIMATPTGSDRPIKVGVIADQTGPLSFVGLANANVARMVIGDINAKGGLLGRRVDLIVEDSATNDAVAA